jgi:nitrate reductase alpha subunit
LPNRQQNTPSFHYVHTDQWRYERGFTAYDELPGEKKREHTIDYQARAVRQGALPFFPQFNKQSAGGGQGSGGGGRKNRSGDHPVHRLAIEERRSCASRWTIPTRRRTGRGSGSSGAATPSARA